jgi:hypothetical protein
MTQPTYEITYHCCQAGLDPDGRIWFAELDMGDYIMKGDGETQEEAKKAIQEKLLQGINFAQKSFDHQTQALLAISRTKD